LVLVLPISQEFELTDLDFRKISALIYEQCGIHIHEGQKELVKARLVKGIRQGGLRSFRDYYEYVVEDRPGREFIHLLHSIFISPIFFWKSKILNTEGFIFSPRWPAAKRIGNFLSGLLAVFPGEIDRGNRIKAIPEGFLSKYLIGEKNLVWIPHDQGWGPKINYLPTVELYGNLFLPGAL
jgi:hypothetical protein